MKATIRLLSSLPLVLLLVSIDASAREAAQKSIVPEQDRICSEKCKGLSKQPTKHESCLIECSEAAKKSTIPPSQAK